jgi:hypothetical protein
MLTGLCPALTKMRKTCSGPELFQLMVFVHLADPATVVFYWACRMCIRIKNEEN